MGARGGSRPGGRSTSPPGCSGAADPSCTPPALLPSLYFLAAAMRASSASLPPPPGPEGSPARGATDVRRGARSPLPGLVVRGRPRCMREDAHAPGPQRAGASISGAISAGFKRLLEPETRGGALVVCPGSARATCVAGEYLSCAHCGCVRCGGCANDQVWMFAAPQAWHETLYASSRPARGMPTARARESVASSGGCSVVHRWPRRSQ
eukprot:364930-Chlamydomonas_euryale.AAC.15